MYVSSTTHILKRQNENVKNKAEYQSKKKKNDGAVGKNDAACQNQNASKKKPHLSTQLFHEDCEISYRQIHDLLKYAALGKCASAAQPSWCRLHHQKHLSGVVVIILRDVTQLHFYRFYLQFRFLRCTFRHRFSLPPPCPNFLSSLIGINQITNEDNGRNEIIGNHTRAVSASDENISTTLHSSVDLKMNPIVCKFGKKKHGLTRYLLSQEEMKNHDYPFVGLPDCVNYVSTDCTGSVTDSSPLFGLDCEMCLTESGSELTRVSLVDADGCCIIDELVKPKNHILDYLTSFSGITKKILRPVTTRLEDIQVRLKGLLPPDAVLVGHSLNNDLRALQMMHPSVIDTSLLYPKKGGGRFKLKVLAKAVLGREIQSEKVTGHDPAEDAKAALDLAQYLIRHGPRKVGELNQYQRLLLPVHNGVTVNATNRAVEVLEDTADQNGFSDEPDSHPSETSTSHLSLLESLHSTGKQLLFLTGSEEGKELSSSCPNKHFLCTSNKEILHRAREEVPLSSLSIVEFSLGFENVEADLMNHIHAKLRMQLAEMLTVYAGPFNEPFSLQSVKDVFEMCGPIHSLSMVVETQQPFVCIQYEVLEAAQMAVELLDGTHIEESFIKVQRPIKETTLDCETILRELDGDIETENIVYVCGIKKSDTEEDLQNRFSHLKDIEHIYLPKDCKSGKNRKYCFIKFLNYTSAMIALKSINEAFEGDLKSRKALTSRNFHDWTLHQHMNPSSKNPSSAQGKPGQVIPSSEWEVKDMMRKLDKTVKRLYKSLHSSTLCLVLMPGINSSHGSFSGFGLMGITTKENSLSGPPS